MVYLIVCVKRPNVHSCESFIRYFTTLIVALEIKKKLRNA